MSDNKPLAPATGSATWRHVMAFAHVMEAKLAQNRHKGDREGWMALSLSRLYELLLKEVDELDLALSNGDANAVAEEAADVANYAMMIADKFAHLHQQPNHKLTDATKGDSNG